MKNGFHCRAVAWAMAAGACLAVPAFGQSAVKTDRAGVKFVETKPGQAPTKPASIRESMARNGVRPIEGQQAGGFRGNPCVLGNCQINDISDARNSTLGAFHCAEDFSPTADGAVTQICWWGAYFDGAGDCQGFEPDDFTITYYSSLNGVPDEAVAFFSQSGGTLTVSGPVATGNLIADFVPEYEYSASHAAVSVVAGECYWVEITNTQTACTWFWEIATGGDLNALQDGFGPDGYTTGDYFSNDLAMCLDVGLGDPSHCLPPPPANDDCADAIAVTCGSSTGGTTSSATTEGTDPEFSCGALGSTLGDGSVWYTFQATDTSAVITLSNSIGIADSLLAIYTGTCGNLVEFQCDDDSGAGLLSEMFVYGLTINQTYYIQVASFPGSTRGDFVLDITCPAPQPPANDACADAESVAIGSFTDGTTVQATIDTNAFECGTAVTSPGVWYTVTGNGTTLTADVCTFAGYDSKISVYCGECGALTCIDGNDDFCGLGSSVTWCAQTGATYRILVHGFGGASGDFTLAVTSDGVSCTPEVQCLPVGACCVGVNCSIVTEAECATMGGVYQGDGTECNPPLGEPLTYGNTPNVAIPDNSPAGISDTLNVPDSVIMGDVNVAVRIPDHTWIADLVISITHGSDTVVLWDRGCGNFDGMNIIFDDEGAVVFCASPTDGTYQPENPLSAFDGDNSSGNWTITVSDNASQDTGTLAAWSVTFDGVGESPCACPCDLAAPFGVLNVFDFLAFQTAFGNEDPVADLAPPFGVFNIFDFLAFQTCFGNGC